MAQHKRETEQKPGEIWCAEKERRNVSKKKEKLTKTIRNWRLVKKKKERKRESEKERERERERESVCVCVSVRVKEKREEVEDKEEEEEKAI